MYLRHTRLLSCLTLLILVWATPVLSVQAHDDHEHSAPDHAVGGGWYYTQTGSGTGKGYAITDYGGIAFWSGFQQLGGVPALGYPVSGRFILGGFVYQATQKALLQWNPGTNSVNLANTFDMLSAANYDDWLVAYRQIPKSFDWSADDPINDWEGTVQNHLTRIFEAQPGDTRAMSAARAALKERFLSDPDWLQRFGLPMALQEFGPMIVVRAQRSALQYWKVKMPWADVGDVTVVLGGDLAKESGLIPAAATYPLDVALAVLSAVKPPTGGLASPPAPAGTASSLDIVRIPSGRLADQLSLVASPTVTVSPHGNYRIYLQLRNEYHLFISSAIEVHLLDARGADLTHATGSITALLPGSTRVVRLLSTDPYAEVPAAVELRFTGTLAGGENHARHISFSGTHYEREGSLHVLHGSVTNNGARTYSLDLNGALFDAAGSVLGMAIGQVSNLLPGETRELRLTTDEDIQGVASHTVAVNVIVPR
ncbi:MAG: FxLYD domain-containing protein [Chloroflexota bacterium]|nr:FxLYD domain-containing protein [Chloroflexota bacterium]MDE2931881.1 FxLYD domain-containing protein [Chloroflexota bacterium]